MRPPLFHSLGVRLLVPLFLTVGTGMLLNRLDEVQAIIERLAEGPEVAAIRVFDKKEGTIVLSADCAGSDIVARRHIASVLAETEWNVTRAAEVLQVDRVTVYNKIRKYGLSR